LKNRKSFEPESRFEAYDVDGDGIVSDEELSAVKAIQEQETAEEKANAQRNMAWVALVSIIVFTIVLFLPIVPDERVKLLGDLSSLFFISMAGVVGAYMGMTAYMNGKR
tara:strand:- start:2277 stop:2603 length:327 start_codon:yes stop_codon:yes gene_type:complete